MRYTLEDIKNKADDEWKLQTPEWEMEFPDAVELVKAEVIADGLDKLARSIDNNTKAVKAQTKLLESFMKEEK